MNSEQPPGANIDAALQRLQSGDFNGALNLLPGAQGEKEQLKDFHFVRGLCFLSLNRPGEALQELTREIESFPENDAARNLLETLDPGSKAARYVQTPQMFEALERTATDSPSEVSAFELQEKSVLLYSPKITPDKERYWQAIETRLREYTDLELWHLTDESLPSGGNFSLSHLHLPAKPSVVVLPLPWESATLRVAEEAKRQGIAVIGLFQELLFYENGTRGGLQNLAPADVVGVWGEHDWAILRRYENKDKVVIVGNPLARPETYQPEASEDLPERYLLYLADGCTLEGRLVEELQRASKIYPVIAYASEPNARLAELECISRVVTDRPQFDRTLYHAFAVIAKFQADLFPALAWSIPVFILDDGHEGHRYAEVREAYPHMFNFVEGIQWGYGQLDQAVAPQREHFQHFFYKADGRNLESVTNLILNYAIR